MGYSERLDLNPPEGALADGPLCTIHPHISWACVTGRHCHVDAGTTLLFIIRHGQKLGWKSERPPRSLHPRRRESNGSGSLIFIYIFKASAEAIPVRQYHDHLPIHGLHLRLLDTRTLLLQLLRILRGRTSAWGSYVHSWATCLGSLLLLTHHLLLPNELLLVGLNSIGRRTIGVHIAAVDVHVISDLCRMRYGGRASSCIHCLGALFCQEPSKMVRRHFLDLFRGPVRMLYLEIVLNLQQLRHVPAGERTSRILHSGSGLGVTGGPRITRHAIHARSHISVHILPAHGGHHVRARYSVHSHILSHTTCHIDLLLLELKLMLRISIRELTSLHGCHANLVRRGHALGIGHICLHLCLRNPR